MAKTKRATGPTTDKPLADQMIDSAKNHPKLAALIATSMVLTHAMSFTTSALALAKDARELSAQHEEAGGQKFVFTGKTLDEAIANAINERNRWADDIKSSTFAHSPTMAPDLSGIPDVSPFSPAYTDYIEKVQTQLSDMQQQLEALKKAVPLTLDLSGKPPKVKF